MPYINWFTIWRVCSDLDLHLTLAAVADHEKMVIHHPDKSHCKLSLPASHVPQLMRKFLKNPHNLLIVPLDQRIDRLIPVTFPARIKNSPSIKR